MMSMMSAVAHQTIAAADYWVADCNRGYYSRKAVAADSQDFQRLPAGNNHPAADYMVARYLAVEVRLVVVVKTSILAHTR